jgi:hypothetical protein
LTTEEIARAFLVAGVDGGPAHRAGQASPRRGAHPIRSPTANRPLGSPRVRARGHLPDLQ